MVAKGVGFLQSIGASIQQALQSTRDETLAIVEQKRAEQGGSAPSSPTTSAPITQQEQDAIPSAPPVLADLPPAPVETPQQVS